MSSATVAPAAATGPTVAPWRRRLASSLLTLAAITALGSAVGGIADLAAADPAVKVLEAWRAYGLVVFTGLFALLALRPWAMQGIWELAIFHKAASPSPPWPGGPPSLQLPTPPASSPSTAP